MSGWASRHFPKLTARAEFYQEAGRRLQAGREDAASGLSDTAIPDDVLRRLG